MHPLLLTFGAAFAAVGAVLVANGMRRPAVDAEAVLAELDTEPAPLDEFAHRLKEPIGARLLRPLAGSVGETIANLVPRRRADQLRHRLLIAGVSAKVGPEEFVVLQGIGAGAGVLFGLLAAQAAGYHGFGLVRMMAITVAHRRARISAGNRPPTGASGAPSTAMVRGCGRCRSPPGRG